MTDNTTKKITVYTKQVVIKSAELDYDYFKEYILPDEKSEDVLRAKWDALLKRAGKQKQFEFEDDDYEEEDQTYEVLDEHIDDFQEYLTDPK